MKRSAVALALMFTLCILAINTRAGEDPAVTRAREVARQQYELEKATRLAAEAKKKLAEQEALQRAIALTRQGAVSLYNPGPAGAGYIPYICRWKLWDGTYTDWTEAKIFDRKALYYTKAGGVKFQIKFASSAGGEKNYSLDAAQLPSDIKAPFEDAKPHNFKWTALNTLDLYTGKPAKW